MVKVIAPLVFAAFLAPTGALAQQAQAPVARAETALVAGWAAPGGARVAGLSIRLAPGWKTYWRSPGDAGIPPQFDWSGSVNVAGVAVEWPAPEVFETFGMTTLGYKGAVTLPLVVTPLDPAAPVALRLGFDFGVCADICVPERTDMTLAIARDAPEQGAALVAEGRARAPLSAEAGGVLSAACGVSGAGATRRFKGRLTLDHAADPATLVVVEGPEGVWFAPAETVAEGAVLSVSAEAQVYAGPSWIGRDALRMTLIAAGGAVDVQGCTALAG